MDPDAVIRAATEEVDNAMVREFFRIMLESEGVVPDEDASAQQLSDRLRQRLEEKED